MLGFRFQLYVGEGLDPPTQNAASYSLKPNVETQNAPFLVILSGVKRSRRIFTLLILPRSFDSLRSLRMTDL